MSPTPQVTAITYRYDRWRALAVGIIETAQATFLLLIAVRVFSADPTSKALVASGVSVGLLASLLVVWIVTARGWSPAATAARLMYAGAAAFALAAAAGTLAVFVIGSVTAMAAMAMTIPLITQVYQDNYPAAVRGKLFSRAVMIRIAVAILFSAAGGAMLARDLGLFRALLGMFAAAFAFGGFCVARMPSRKIVADGLTSPWRALRYVREDRLFRLTLICWMLMGFANLMMLPMRVEYLANPRYGVALSAALIALLTGVIPNIARLVVSPLAGWFFDKVNFFALRVWLNLGFALGILTFFTSDTLPGFVLGAVIFGVSTAGGEVAWNLWVTKVAPPNRVADYMSVHTFFTGLRGAVAPLVAFHLVAAVSIAALGWFSAGLIVLASLVLLREVLPGKTPDPGTRLVEEATTARDQRATSRRR